MNIKVRIQYLVRCALTIASHGGGARWLSRPFMRTLTPFMSNPDPETPPS